MSMLLRRCWAMCLALLLMPVAMASGYPERPVRLVHGFAAGGGADTVARLIGQELAKTMGQPFVVESRTGAGSTIAADTVARATADGYTLYAPMSTHVISAAIFKSLPYDPVDDFQFISTVHELPMVMVVRSESALHTVADVIAAAKARPGALSYGSAGIGTPTHLVGELLSAMAGVRVNHVPYRGEAQVVADLMGGSIEIGFVAASGVAAHAKSGRVRPIAVTGSQRIPLLPDLPTVAESGVAGFEVSSWFGFAAPKGTPRPVVEALHAQIIAAIAQSAVRERLIALGAIPTGSASPEAMRTRVASELARWRKVVEDAGIPRQ